MAKFDLIYQHIL